MGKVDRIMGQAIKEIFSHPKQRQNMVAVIEKGGAILSIGRNNMTKTNPAFFNGEHDLCIHAEYDALRQLRDAKGTNLYVFRFKKSGGLGTSKPCSDCMKVIKERGVHKVFYFDKGKFIKGKVNE